MIEAAKVIVANGEGEEVGERAIAAGLQASTVPYPEDGLDEVLVWTESESKLFEESLLVQTIGQAQYFEVQVFVPDNLQASAKAKLEDLGIPTAQQLSETGWNPGATGIPPLPRTDFPYAAVVSRILPSSKSAGLL